MMDPPWPGVQNLDPGLFTCWLRAANKAVDRNFD